MAASIGNDVCCRAFREMQSSLAGAGGSGFGVSVEADASAFGTAGEVEIVQDFVGFLLPLQGVEPLGEVLWGHGDGHGGLLVAVGAEEFGAG